MHTRFSRKGVHGFFRDMTKGTTGVPLFVVFRIDLLRSLEQFFAFIGQLSVYHLVEQTVQRCADLRISSSNCRCASAVAASFSAR